MTYGGLIYVLLHKHGNEDIHEYSPCKAAYSIKYNKYNSCKDYAITLDIVIKRQIFEL